MMKAEDGIQHSGFSLQHSRQHIVRRTVRRTGRLIPRRLRGLRARCVVLKPGADMGWHSTGHREELLIGLAGRAIVEIARTPREVQRVHLPANTSVWLATQTRHRVLNRTRAVARYLYVTGR